METRSSMRTIGFCLLWIGIGAKIAFGLGPFESAGIAGDDPRLRIWAANVRDYLPASGAELNSEIANVTGIADGQTLSLGDRNQLEVEQGMSPGTVTVEFGTPFRNENGWDFAVFENAFSIAGDNHLFAELAYVEVSSDGDHFARFPATSLTTQRVDYGFGTAFSAIDPTDVHNLAGRHSTFSGTPFDLAELVSAPPVQRGEVDLQQIQWVRLVDVPGSRSLDDPLLTSVGQVAFPDAWGNPILDPWDTSPTGTAGFDLDAVGARWPSRLFHPKNEVRAPSIAVPEPSKVSGMLVVVVFCSCGRKIRRCRVRPLA